MEYRIEYKIYELNIATFGLPYPDPPPPHPGICGALVGLYRVIGSSLSPHYVGDSRVLSLLSRNVGHRGFVPIQDGGDRSCEDFWVHFSTWDHSRWRIQALTGIRRIRFILIQISTSINLGHEFKKANT